MNQICIWVYFCLEGNINENVLLSTKFYPPPSISDCVSSQITLALMSLFTCKFSYPTCLNNELQRESYTASCQLHMDILSTVCTLYRLHLHISHILQPDFIFPFFFYLSAWLMSAYIPALPKGFLKGILSMHTDEYQVLPNNWGSD